MKTPQRCRVAGDAGPGVTLAGQVAEVITEILNRHPQRVPAAEPAGEGFEVSSIGGLGVLSQAPLVRDVRQKPVSELGEADLCQWLDLAAVVSDPPNP